MPKTKAVSPARSQGGITTPKRKTTRGSRSLCSPALSTASGRLTSLIDQFKDKNMESFALSPLNGRSVLNDNTEIEEPRRKSWWKKLDENSQDVMEVLEDNKLTVNNPIEEFDIEVLSQEKKNYTLDLPESSDNESINSIVLPQRRLFTQKEHQPQKKFGHLIDNRESLAKLHKTNNTNIDKTVNVGTRELFQNAKRSKPIFPAALLIISPNKTVGDKTRENALADPKPQVRNIFGKRPANKRKNMFADFIVSESEDEIPDIEPKVFGFQKKLEQRRVSSVSRGREASPASSITTDIEMDFRMMLPSSTMVENQLEEMVASTPVKRARLSKLSEAKESEAGTLQTTTSDKTKQSNKSASSKNKSKASPEMKDKSLNSSRTTRSMLKNASKLEENMNTSIKQNTKGNKSKSKISSRGDEFDVSPTKTNKQSATLNKSQSQNKSKTRNSPKTIETEIESDENAANVVNAINNVTRVINKSTNKSLPNTTSNKSVNEKERTVTLKVHGKVDKTSSNDVEENEQEDDENNFTLEYEQDEVIDEAEVHNENQKENTKKHNTVVLEQDCQETQINKSKSNKSSLTNKSIQKLQKPAKTVEESVESQTEQFSADDNVDGNHEMVTENVQNQESKDEEMVNDEIDEVANNSHENMNEEVEQENVEEVIVSQGNEDEANESEDNRDENNAFQENEDEHNESQEVVNESLEVENQSEEEEEGNERENEEDEANESEQEGEANESQEVANESQEVENENDQSQEVEAEVNESHKVGDESQEVENDESENEDEEDEGNQSQEVEAEVNESQEVANESQELENDENESKEDEDQANESQEVEAEVNESHEIEEDANESQKIEEEANESQDIDEEAHESHIVEDDEAANQDSDEEMEEDEAEAANETEVNVSSANESQEVENDEAESEAEVNESAEVEEDQQMEDSDEADKAIASDPEISDQDDNQTDEMEVDGDEQESDNAEESEHHEHVSHEERQIEDQNEIDPSEEIEESPNVTHDTTGRHRKKDLNKSPEVILHDKTNQMDSFTAKGRNTSVRKTKNSMIKNLNIRPSLAPPRDSTGFSDGTKNSSAEGSGWDSHRTTRKTLRQTFGKDFTPRKSLRAMVMEKSAKRQTEHMEMHSETVKFPLANSTEMPEDSNLHVDDVVESDHELSRRTRQTTLEQYLQKIKEQNIENKFKMEAAVRNSLKATVTNSLSHFKVPNKPAPRRPKPIQTKPKKQLKSMTPFGELPSEVIEDMKYKPPKRFQPTNASWTTKRLYKFLETKLEPTYDYKARVRAEKLVETIYLFVKDLRRHDVAPAAAVDQLKHELARLNIVRTHFDFYDFFHEFMPREVRIKVVPDIVNKIALPRHGVFSDILRGNIVHE